MSKPRDYYEVLGLTRGATADEIRRAYRKLARQLHPDVNKATDSAKKFAEVQEAYDVLSDSEKRSAYDRFGHAGATASHARSSSSDASGARAGWRTAAVDDFQAEDISSMFEQMFGGMGVGVKAGTGQRTRPNRVPVPGRDIEHTITVTFMTAAMGGTEQLRLGIGGSTSEITVRIPPGINSGAKLRIKGKGHPSPSGGPPGDLILTVEVGKHPWFSRDGLDLYIEVPITIVEAVKGVTISVPLLKDGAVDVKVPQGISSGRKLRVRGKGITDSKGTTGDLYVLIQIVAPEFGTLSSNSQQAIDRLAAEIVNPRNAPPWVDE